jgi:hypothetical protein
VLQRLSCPRHEPIYLGEFRTRGVILRRSLRLSPFQLSLPKFSGFRGIGSSGHGGFLEEVAPALMVVAGTLRFLERFECGFRLLLPANDRDHSGRPVGSDVVQDDGVRGVVVVACQKKSVCDGVNRLSPPDCVQIEKRRSPEDIASPQNSSA